MKLEDLSRVPAEAKAAVMQIVEQTKRRSGWRVYRTLAALGVPRSVFYAWKKRESLEDRVGKPCRVYEVLPEERAAMCEFALRYPKIGYRKLTWMMVDAAVACVGESTVYRVLSDAELLSRWKRSTVSSGEYNFRPNGPNQQWHADVMYVWVAARFYFLLCFVDAYSRYIVHHKLLISLDGQSVAVELQAALEAAKDARPRVVHDHGSEFVNRDVAAVIKTHNLIDIKTRPRHPESNGIVERFNGTVRDGSDNDYGNNYLQAEAIIAKLMQQYNEERLHATLGYMTPATWHRGQPDEVRDERARRIAAARAHRKMTNQQRFTEAA
ncbi:MAG: integrase core domain-containing protein [Pseudomonadota bacterium]|nr:integrase core domain-containing protein [Pseudomonadota bacterium]